MKTARGYYQDASLYCDRGWVIEIMGEQGIEITSENISFPFNVDKYGKKEEESLIEKIKECYPGVEVEVNQ